MKKVQGLKDIFRTCGFVLQYVGPKNCT